MRPRIVRSPVDICFGTRPSHAAKSCVPIARRCSSRRAVRWCRLRSGSISKSNAPLAQRALENSRAAVRQAEQHATVQVEAAYQTLVVSVIKVFETASRANGGRLWLVWLMTLRGSPFVLHVNALARADIAKAMVRLDPRCDEDEHLRVRWPNGPTAPPFLRTASPHHGPGKFWMLGKRYSAQGPRRVLIS